MYYIFAYSPNLDPFAETDMEGHRAHARSQWSPNPVDQHLLSWRLITRAHSNRGNDCPTKGAVRRRLALTKVRVQHHPCAGKTNDSKCMPMMSDLQLLTGLAIMISGFAQLRSCISTFHWQKLVHLAWFSCMIHLCSLTFLRDHLRKNRIAQIWRLPGMLSLIGMLLFALANTAQYNATLGAHSSNDDLYRPAICYMSPQAAFSLKNWPDGIQRRVLSMIYLIFGMIRNVQGLYRAPSDYLLYVRKRFSDAAKRFLMCRYGSGRHDSILGCMAAIVVYRPLLAAFLTERLCIDVLTSRAFEVSNNTHPCLKTISY